MVYAFSDELFIFNTLILLTVLVSLPKIVFVLSPLIVKFLSKVTNFISLPKIVSVLLPLIVKFLSLFTFIIKLLFVLS